MAPSYLSDLCVRLANVPGPSNLRSASNGDLLIPRINRGRLGTRGFSYACPTAWNSLNDYLKIDTLTFGAFKKQLKHTFSLLEFAARAFEAYFCLTVRVNVCLIQKD